MRGVVIPLAYVVGMLVVGAVDPMGRQRRSRQHPETQGERYRRNSELIDHARIALVDHATENGRR